MYYNSYTIYNLQIINCIYDNYFYGFRFPCEVRVRSVPLTPCRRKKRQVEEPESPRGVPTTIVPQKSEQNNDTQVQSSQV